MTASIRELREQLQAPRRAVDTWYGRQVMRRFSIYLTWIFLPLKITPNQVTFLSLIASLISGFFFIFEKKLAWGIGLLNVWYLLDHVDGEIARYTRKASATGFYFDTMINFIVQPLAFLSLGICLNSLNWGIAGAYGFLMLMILPMCEDVIHYSLLKKTGSSQIVVSVSSTEPALESTRSFPKTAFVIWHKLLTFPNFLLVTTLSYMACKVFHISSLFIFSFLLIFYALSSNLVWVIQLTEKIKSHKLDSISKN